jgi:hypothetical protein
MRRGPLPEDPEIARLRNALTQMENERKDLNAEPRKVSFQLQRVERDVDRLLQQVQQFEARGLLGRRWQPLAVVSLEGASRRSAQPGCYANGAAQRACQPIAVVRGKLSDPCYGRAEGTAGEDQTGSRLAAVAAT